jgi:hypothetical protein
MMKAPITAENLDAADIEFVKKCGLTPGCAGRVANPFAFIVLRDASAWMISRQ